MADSTTGGGEPDPRSPPTPDPGLDWPRIAAIMGLIAVGVLLFTPVLIPVCMAVLIAYLLAPPVELLEGLSFGRVRIRRFMAVIAVYAFVLAALVGAAAILLPRFWSDARAIATRVPEMAQTMRDDWIPRIDSTFGIAPPPAGEADAAAQGADAAAPAPLVRVVPEADGGFAIVLPAGGLVVEDEGNGRFRIQTARPARRMGLGALVTNLLNRTADYLDRESLRVLRQVQGAVVATGQGILVAFFVFVGSGYLLMTAGEATAFAASLVPPSRRPGLGRLVVEIDRGLSGVVRGQVLIALANGALSGAGFFLLGLDHWVILAVLTTVASIVPVFGSLIASVPAVLIGLEQGVGTAALVVAWLLGIHQLEASVLNPRIMGDAARLSPVLVLFALLAGERTIGGPGLLLAVPVLSVLSSVLLHVRDRAYGPEARPAAATRASTSRPVDTGERAGPAGE